MRSAAKLLTILIAAFLLYSCSSTKEIRLKVEERPKPVAAQALYPPFKVKEIADVGDVGYKAKLFYNKGLLYIGNLDGEVYAVNPEKKSKRLIVDIKEPIEAGVLVLNGKLYVATTKGRLYLIDLDLHKTIAKKQFPFPIMRDIYYHNGRLYVLTEDDKVTCLNPGNLNIIWSYSNGEPGRMDIRSTAGLLFTKNGIYTGFSDGSVAKISYRGDLIWSSQVGNGNMFIDSDATPLGASRIFVTSVNGYTEALSPDDGSTIWRRNISGYSNMQENIFGLFLADNNGDVVALDNDNGETIWKKKLSNKYNIYGIKLIGNNLLVAVTGNGNLVALDAIRGKIMDIRRNIDDDISSHLLLVEDKLYLISRDGNIYQISSKIK